MSYESKYSWETSQFACSDPQAMLRHLDAWSVEAVWREDKNGLGHLESSGDGSYELHPEQLLADGLHLVDEEELEDLGYDTDIDAMDEMSFFDVISQFVNDESPGIAVDTFIHYGPDTSGEAVAWKKGMEEPVWTEGDQTFKDLLKKHQIEIVT